MTYPQRMKKGEKIVPITRKKRMEEIVSTHRVLPLPASQEKDVERTLEKTRKLERGV